MQIKAIAAIAVLSAVLAGCATSGPTYADLQATQPAAAPTSGRIYMYREGTMFGSAVQPAVKVNDVKVGEAIPGGYFWVDELPGTYKVSSTTEKEESVDVSITPGQTRYIRFDISMGVFVGHVSPSIIDPSQATKEIKDCHYTPMKTN